MGWRSCGPCRGTGRINPTGKWEVMCMECNGKGKIYTPDKSKDKKSGPCFIATAAYESPLAPEVLFFRQFRDNVLLRSKLGDLFVEFYYLVSPPIASLITKHPRLKVYVRDFLLNPLMRFLRK